MGQPHLSYFGAATWQYSRGILVVGRHESRARSRPRPSLCIACYVMSETTALLHVQYLNLLTVVKQMDVVDSLGTVFPKEQYFDWMDINRTVSVGPQLVPRTLNINIQTQIHT